MFLLNKLLLPGSCRGRSSDPARLKTSCRGVLILDAQFAFFFRLPLCGNQIADYTSPYRRCGKVRPLSKLLRNHHSSLIDSNRAVLRHISSSNSGSLLFQNLPKTLLSDLAGTPTTSKPSKQCSAFSASFSRHPGVRWSSRIPRPMVLLLLSIETPVPNVASISSTTGVLCAD